MAQNTQDDVVDIPAGDMGDDDIASSRRTGGMSRPLKFSLMAGAAIIALSVGMAYQTTTAPVAESQVVRPPALDTTPGGETQVTNERFRNSMLQANDERAAMASDLGVTFIPTPENVLTPIAPVNETVIVVPDAGADTPAETAPVVVAQRTIAPPPPVRRPVAEPVAREPVRAPVQQTASAAAQANATGEKEENPYAQNIQSQMSAVSKVFQMPTSTLVQGTGTAKDIMAAQTAADAAKGGTAVANGGAAMDPSMVASTSDGSSGSGGGDIILRPGDILYAETINAVNSDAVSGVLAEITTGEYKGARLVGAFEVPTGADGLVVSFSAMTLENGDTIAMNGIAVDGRTAETAVASDIDRRYVKRYGPVFGATFLSAFAAAAAAPRQTVTAEGAVVTDQFSTDAAALQGASAAMGQIAGDLAMSAPKGPKISLRSRAPLAILIMEPVENPN